MKHKIYNKYEQSFGGRENYFSCKLQKDRVGDCSIRAIAHATEFDYMKVMKDLFELGLELGVLPNDDLTVSTYLKKNGFTKNSPLKTEKGKKYEVRFFPAEQSKNYVIRTCGHLTSIVKGKVLDSWNCGEQASQTFYVK